jgi:hypothetical protein
MPRYWHGTGTGTVLVLARYWYWHGTGTGAGAGTGTVLALVLAPSRYLYWHVRAADAPAVSLVLCGFLGFLGSGGAPARDPASLLPAREAASGAAALVVSTRGRMGGVTC